MTGADRALVSSPVQAVAELDCVLSLALAAREQNLRRPELSRTNEILIKGGASRTGCGP